MIDEPVTTAHLLTAWRDAIGAAELADRLAAAAAEAASQADVRALGSDEIAALAERAAEAATRAADRARAAATEAAELARSLRESGIAVAEANVADMRAMETEAAAGYHDAEERARRDALWSAVTRSDSGMGPGVPTGAPVSSAVVNRSRRLRTEER